MRTMKLVSVLIIAAFLFGCASGAKMENMVVYTGLEYDQKAYDEALKDAINVASVSGGEKTNPAWTSEISNESFAEAVRRSLADHGLLSESGGRFQLNVNLLNVDQPMVGLDMTVTTNVRYILTDTQDNTVVLDEIIAAQYTATVGDSFVGVKRLRLANEGSGKKNIKGLLDKLSELKIESQEISVN